MSPRTPAQMSRVRAIGDAGEDVVGGLHTTAHLHDATKVIKLPTPYRVIGGKGGRLTCVPCERSTVDHWGYLGSESHDPGRAVLTETKRCNESRFNFGAIKPHQREALDDALAAKCIVHLVVVYGPGYVPCAIPWGYVQTKIASGAKSLTGDEVLRYRVASGENYLAVPSHTQPNRIGEKA